jgi:hypothetical protein
MTIELDCRDDLPRRRLLRERDGNGIDWVELDDDGRTLTIAFLGPAPRVDRGNVRIEGGTAGTPLRVVDAWLCDEDDPDRDRCFKVRLDRPCEGNGFTSASSMPIPTADRAGVRSPGSIRGSPRSRSRAESTVRPISTASRVSHVRRRPLTSPICPTSPRTTPASASSSWTASR